MRHKSILMERISDGMLYHSTEQMLRDPRFRKYVPKEERVEEDVLRKPGRPKKED